MCMCVCGFEVVSVHVEVLPLPCHFSQFQIKVLKEGITRLHLVCAGVRARVCCRPG